jgi:hypothetical protein
MFLLIVRVLLEMDSGRIPCCVPQVLDSLFIVYFFDCAFTTQDVARGPEKLSFRIPHHPAALPVILLSYY